MMTKILTVILSVCVCLVFMQCNKRSTSSDSHDDGVSGELTTAERHLIESDNKFGLEVFREIVKEDKDSNVFISPLSVSMALGMTYNGANGETQKAMQEVLELSGLTLQEVNESYQHLIELLRGLDPKVRFQIANSIWFRETREPEKEFIDLCKEYFDALVRAMNFADPNAAKVINGWVYDNTNGKIKEIVEDPMDPLTLMLLINAIYFKGTWTYQFHEESTKDDLFTLPDGTKAPCRMMEQRGFYKYFFNDDFQAVDLPYGDADFSMTIFLPNPKVDINSLIAQFTPENLSYWLGSFSSDSGDIFIPKFKLEYELGLNQVLKTMGMEIAFDPYHADFTKMYKGGGVWIDTVIHKTFVEVNEEGTEAAAVTVVVMTDSAREPSGFHMRVDRPFMFLIRENKSQTILFIGKIVEPTVE
jgi:serine protease inhibitor